MMKPRMKEKFKIKYKLKKIELKQVLNIKSNAKKIKWQDKEKFYP